MEIDKSIYSLINNTIQNIQNISATHCKHTLGKNYLLIMIAIPASMRFKCDVCDFVAKCEGGLKTHKKRKHRQVLL
jgi:hypothetical protein